MASGPTAAGLNEQEGAGVARGVMELQESVTVPEYPLIGLTVIVATAVKPACTLVGKIAVVTAIVYWLGVMDSTVKLMVAVFVSVLLGLGPVPVTVRV